MAELCVLSDAYTHYRQSLVVYRNDQQVLQLDFFDWPSPPNSAFAEAHNLAREIFGSYSDLPAKGHNPVVSARPTMKLLTFSGSCY